MAATTDEKISVDEQFLRNYVNRGLKAQVIGAEQEIDKENVDEFLREQVASNKEELVKTKLQKRAENLDAADDERLAREKQQEEQKQAAAQEKQREKREKEQQTQAQRLRKAAGNTATQVGNSVQPALDRVASLHTVGGIGLLLLILAVLLFTVVQVNAAGDTRLKQLWAMLNGNAQLIGRANETGSGGLSGVGAAGGGNPIGGVGGAVNGSTGTSQTPVTLSATNGAFRSLPPLLGV